jgi:hypothetical protein
MCHITTWEEDYKGNNTFPSLQSPLANSSSPSCTRYVMSNDMKGRQCTLNWKAGKGSDMGSFPRTVPGTTEKRHDELPSGYLKPVIQQR